MKRIIIILLIYSVNCLVYAKTGKEIIAENGFRTNVPPMLETHWSQDGGENSMLPQNENGTFAKTGCGATALAQILRYWKQPASGIGNNFYYWKEIPGKEKVLYADFRNTHYDWENMIPVYKNNTSAKQEQINAVSTLMAHIGIALEMRYWKNMSNETATQIEYIHTVLKKYYGYNQNSTLVRYINGAYTMDEWLSMIYRELSEGRPVLMGGTSAGNGNHIFVADGYDEEGKVHLNLGHANKNNEDKYYDLTRTDQTYTKDMRMILGICPETLEGELTTVYISTSGTLIDVLGGEINSKRVCRLKISGRINNDDIQLLEELTRTTTGQLSYIDISQCVVEGNVIGNSAFNDTKGRKENNYTLQQIILPESIERIQSYAFKNCCGLYSINIPQHVQFIGKGAFFNCRYLNEMYLPNSLSSVDQNPFVYDKFDSYEIASDNPFFQINNNALLDKDGKKLYSMQYKCFDEYRIPNGVEVIEQQAFVKCCMMTSLVLPASLKQIKGNAFIECHSLTDVYSHATTAPALNNGFDSSVSKCILHVPAGCIGEYEQKGWTMFAQIVDDVQKSYSDIIAENGFQTEVQPLISTLWSKDDEVLSSKFPNYNDGATTQKMIASNGAITMAQIMKHWQYPSFGKNQLFFTQPMQEENVSFSADFSSTHYDWNKMLNDCNNASLLNAQQKNAVSELVYHCAVATFNKQVPAYKDGATQMEYCSSALKKFFGYNSDMHLLNSAFYELNDWVTIIYKELSEGRPIMVESIKEGNDNVYIIDGYSSDGMLHIKRDGMESFLSPDDVSVYSPNIRILIGITPEEKVEETVNINLSSAGSLAEALGDDSKTITKLKLTGPINANDFSLLKKMAQLETGQLYSIDLSEATIEDNNVNAYSFQYCDLLQYVTLPSGLDKIGRHGFSYCYNLLSIEFPQIKAIDNYAFFFCRYLNNVCIPSSMNTIGDNPFASNKMNRFTVEEGSIFKVSNHTLQSNNGQIIYSCLGDVGGYFEIPNMVKKVRNMAFRGCDGITSLVIPESVTSIGTYSFYECYNIKDVYCYSTTAPTLSSDLESYAFYPEYATCTLHVPEGCISEYEQKYWDKFMQIVDDLPNSATTIDSNTIVNVGKKGKRYNLLGEEVENICPQRIYIVKETNGKVKKIILR